MTRGWYVVMAVSVCAAAAASCGKLESTPSDAGVVVDASTTCATNADCANGTQCRFAVSDGCNAVGKCIAPPQIGNCKGEPACACDGTSTSVCESTATVRVRSTGVCPPEGCSSVACETCDLSGFVPLTMSKPNVEHGACTSNEVSAFVDACLGSQANGTSCQTWQTQSADAGTCYPCIFSLQTAATWGPIVCTSQECFLNSGGCVDLERGDLIEEQGLGGAGSCGDLVTASLGCLDTACGTCATTSDFDACVNDADAHGCKTYVDATNTSSLCAGEAGATPCTPATDSDDVAFVNIFCGP